MKKIIAGLAIAVVSLSGAVSAQDTVPAHIKYQRDYAKLPGFVNQVIADPDRTRDALEVANERRICKGSKVISARWRDDIVLAVKCPAGYAAAGGGLPGALTGTALTTGAAVGLVAIVTVLVVASGGDGGGTTTTTTTTSSTSGTGAAGN